MRQLVQTLKNGEVQILDVPLPILSGGMVLVRNYYSLISPGTEGSTVSVARKSLVGKAKGRPQQVKQAFEIVKKQGPVQAYRAVRRKLDAYSPLGYSCAGEVIDIGPDVKEFCVGDFVGCGGGNANHSEIVAIPCNLCVKLRPDADLKKAAYNTLGAIALQGVRQADLNIGETCAVIGLGIIGQLTCLILRASGIKVIGIDIDSKMVDIAREHCADLTLQRDEAALVEIISEFTGKIGVDGVIISAATKSLDPINFAGEISRKKGKVVIVGDVPTGFEREDYYRKELDLRMSCSYGPGRYDINYEEKGIDYPVSYVRWTEKRNMEAFQALVHFNKVDIDYMTTHIFNIVDAPKAYDLILQRKESFLGILIKHANKSSELNRKIETRKRLPLGKINVAFIGAGNYAMIYLLPNFPKDKDVILKGVLDSSGISSRTAAEKHGFEFCTSDEDEIFCNDEINTIFIATRHNSHAHYVLKSLKAGKHVSVEKPLCLREEELEEIKKVYYSVTNCPSSPFLLVGFNRRFAPLAEILKMRIGDGPMAMIYRINAGNMPVNSWMQDKEIGGGRIIGEVCHFIDFLTFLNGSIPESVFAVSMQDHSNTEDTINVNLKFKNGSIGTISYFANGSRSFFKEYIEVYKAGMTGIIKDFKEIEIFSTRKKIKKKLLTLDKGQGKMIKTFFNSIREGNSSPIDFEEIYAVVKTTFKIIESIRTKKEIQIT